jgi:asparagine synthase (glutamine-hydrolysing)
MCGLFGALAPRQSTLSIDADLARRLRDLLERRGPDDAGEWSAPGAYLGSRRLAVIDPSSAGRQPMVGPDDPELGGPRHVLAYNGELYNEPELRAELECDGVRFRSHCDTETVLHALIRWGAGALPRFRGMFALAFHDAREHTVLLARDPLGVKPLYYAATRLGRPELVFASEPTPILGHPGVPAEPNAEMVSAYMTTIRTVLGSATMFAHVHAVRPGESVTLSFDRGEPRAHAATHWRGPAERNYTGFADAAECVGHAVERSLAAHLRSDVPTCCLLSGGLDSAILTSLAADRHDDLLTYCAGSVGADDDSDDLAAAQRYAFELGVGHAQAHVTEDHFSEMWPRMVHELGVPLSTPNEVAIHAVAERLRRDGRVVTISGEGADELFAGYDLPLRQADAFAREHPDGAGAGELFLTSAAWTPMPAKPAVLNQTVWDAIGHDAWLRMFAQREFDAAAEEVGGTGLSAHLRMQRRINLTGLLQRLDTATMLASVEGRTPFADREIADLAEALPLGHRIVFEEELDDPVDGAVAIATRAETKRVLREAFRARLPRWVIERPKRSFPVPFQRWIAAHAGAVRHSALCEATFTPAAIQIVVEKPEQAWNLAWPMINLAHWGERWWGRG